MQMLNDVPHPGTGSNIIFSPGGGVFVHMLVCSLRLNNLPMRFLDSIRHYMSNTTLGRLFLFNGLFDEEFV